MEGNVFTFPCRKYIILLDDMLSQGTMEMDILYRDDRLLAAVKPAGVLSTDELGGMPSLLRTEFGDEALFVRSVHRLDRAVGGVMVYALTRRAAGDLSRQIRDGIFKKEYLAVVSGGPEETSGVLRDFLHRDRSRRMTVIVPEGTEEAQEAVLAYETLSVRDGLSLLRVELHTGRTHQIRCQLAGHGLPILGDRKYGVPGEDCGVALWSRRIRCLHPRTGEELVFYRDPPDDFPWNLFQDAYEEPDHS